MRRALMMALGFAVIASTAHAAAVSGYVRRDGTYVPPSYRSAPNSTTLDNYSTRGNVNPYTGQTGTQQPTYGYTPPPVYRAPPTTYTAPTYSAPTHRAPTFGSSFGQKPAGSSYGY